MPKSETPLLDAVMPPAMMERALELRKERKHFWIATVGFEMSDEALRSGATTLDASKIHFQNIRCIICMMGYKKGREGRICSGLPA